MKNVSQQYLNTINLHRTEAVRHQMHAEVYLGAIDETATNDIQNVVTSPTLPISDIQRIFTGTTNPDLYATSEEGSFILGSNRLWLPNSIANLTRDKGYVSQAVSDESGLFVENKIDVTFKSVHSFVGITLTFDTSQGVPPLTIVTQAYDEIGTLLFTETLNGNTDNTVVLQYGFVEVKRVVLNFNNSVPRIRVRLRSLIWGIGYRFTGASLFSLTNKREMHPLNLTLPVDNLSFEIADMESNFDPKVRSALVNFLEEGQTVQLRYGYDISEYGDNSEIEWFSGNTYYLASWRKNGVNAVFSATDLINQMTKTIWDRFFWNYSPVTFKALATAVLDSLDIQNGYVDDTRLRNYRTNGLVPIDTHANVLQQIAIASQTLLFNKENRIFYGATGINTDIATWVNLLVYGLANETLDSNITSTTLTPDTNIQYANAEEGSFILGSDRYWLPNNYSALLPNSGLRVDLFPNETTLVYPDYWQRLDFRENITFGSLHINFGNDAVKQIEIGLRRAVTGGSEFVNRQFVDVNGQTEIDVALNFQDIVWCEIQISSAMYPNVRPYIQGINVNVSGGRNITTMDIIDFPKEEVADPCYEIITNQDIYPAPTTIREEIAVIDLPVDTYNRTLISKPYIGHSIYPLNYPADFAWLQFPPNTWASSWAVRSMFTSSLVPTVTIEYTGFPVPDPARQEIRQGVFPTATVSAEIKSYLNTDMVTVNRLLDWAYNYYVERFMVEFECLGYPEIEAGDIIDYQGIPCRVLENTITMTGGGCRGKMRLRKVAE